MQFFFSKTNNCLPTSEPILHYAKLNVALSDQKASAAAEEVRLPERRRLQRLHDVAKKKKKKTADIFEHRVQI